MAFGNLFKSKEELFRTHVRACFDESVKGAVKNNMDVFKDLLCGGLTIQTAIVNVYQKMINEPTLQLFAAKSSFDPIKIIKEECTRALSKYSHAL